MTLSDDAHEAIERLESELGVPLGSGERAQKWLDARGIPLEEFEERLASISRTVFDRVHQSASNEAIDFDVLERIFQSGLAVAFQQGMETQRLWESRKAINKIPQWKEPEFMQLTMAELVEAIVGEPVIMGKAFCEEHGLRLRVLAEDDKPPLPTSVNVTVTHDRRVKMIESIGQDGKLEMP